MTLYGMLAGFDEAELCGECGCAALFHAPCCGACAVCGNKVCDEFLNGTACASSCFRSTTTCATS